MVVERRKLVEVVVERRELVVVEERRELGGGGGGGGEAECRWMERCKLEVEVVERREGGRWWRGTSW